jgi:hypothetical protein
LFAFFEWSYVYKVIVQILEATIQLQSETPYSSMQMQMPMSSYENSLPQASGLTIFAFLTLFQPMPQHTAKPVAADPAKLLEEGLSGQLL